jgi:hypothetical protein
VLLVDHAQDQIAKLDAVLYQCMGADHQRELAG